MARMANAVTPMVASKRASEFDCHFTLVPKDDGAYGSWSIDAESMGETWHDSSWMLRKGLDVIEDIDFEPPVGLRPPRWRLAPWLETFPALQLFDGR